MEASKAIATALTIREYDQTKRVDSSSIRMILDAGRLTASARNKQPWAFIVVTDKDLLRKIAELSPTGRHIANASFAIAVLTDPQNKWHEIDSARAIQSMTIQAWDLGLGGSWVGSIDKEKVKQLLSVPQNLNLLTVIPFGYPTVKYAGKKKRKAFDEIAFLDSYGRKFE